jgi:hypothetical protein
LWSGFVLLANLVHGFDDGAELVGLGAVVEIAAGGGYAAVSEESLDGANVFGGGPCGFCGGSAEVVDAELGADACGLLEAVELCGDVARRVGAAAEDGDDGDWPAP